MKGYELKQQPFYYNVSTQCSLYHGVSLERNRLPIIAKRHDFVFIKEKSQQHRLNQAINAAVMQAKVSHRTAANSLKSRSL
jgi:hypothetical protein